MVLNTSSFAVLGVNPLVRTMLALTPLIDRTLAISLALAVVLTGAVGMIFA